MATTTALKLPEALIARIAELASSAGKTLHAFMVEARPAFDEMERLTDFLLATDAAAARETGAIPVAAISYLAQHPLVGRIVEQGLRELVISRGHTGYVALYRFDSARDCVIILAIKHQRELDFGE